jgi:phosphate transport system ATP-binding protein
MAQQAKIIIKGLNFYYHNKSVIKDLSLEIPAKEIMAVFGPANSGTTTLLRTLNRLYDTSWMGRAFMHLMSVLQNCAGK